MLPRILSHNLIKRTELEQIVQQNRKLEATIEEATKFIKEIERGNLDGVADAEMEGDSLMSSLVAMRSRLKLIAEEERERNWVTEGLARFSEILRTQNDSLNTMADRIITGLVKYMEANQAALYLVNKEDKKDLFIELISCYAYDRKKHLIKRVEIGEGLLGQAVLDKTTNYMTQVPGDYIKITSGLGEALPRNILIVPLKLNEEVYGLVEMASFQTMKGYQIEFMEKLSETIASMISAVQTTAHTQRLLNESQSYTEQLHSREEELQQNMEELSATQEAMLRTQEETTAERNKLSAILDSAVDAIVTIDERGRIESVNKSFHRLFGYSVQEIIGQNIKVIVPSPHHENHDQYLKNYLSTGSAKIIGQTRQMEGRRKDGSVFHVELAVNVATIGNRRVFTGILRDVTERHNAENERQLQTEQLKAQEEELRQNMEELSAQQEAMVTQMDEISKLKGDLEVREQVFGYTTILSEADEFGTITYVNDKLCQVSQYRRDELVGKPHNIFRHPDMPKELFKEFWKTIKGRQVFKGIVKNQAKDGSAYWVDATIVPIMGNDGKIVKYVGARYHITDESFAVELYNKQALALNLRLLPLEAKEL
ncbi:MAG: PAS domain S-box protein [Chryseolinea sp.]